MKTILFAFSFLICFYINAQTIDVGVGNSQASIDNYGRLFIGGVEKGKIITNGNILNTSDVIIGHVYENGKIENANNILVGSLTENYEIKNVNNQVIGRLTSTRAVNNSQNENIGTWPEAILPAWVAVAYFFLQP